MNYLEIGVYQAAHKFRISPSSPNLFIDHIFYSPAYFEAAVFKCIIHDRNGYHASDHLPQYTELKIKS